MGRDSRPNAPRTSCSLVTEPSATDRRASPPRVPPTPRNHPESQPGTKARGPGPAASQAQARPLGRRSQQATPTLGLPGKATKDTSTTASTAFSSCDPSPRSTDQVGRRREEAGGAQKKIADFSEPTATTTSRRKQTQNGRQPRSLSTSRQPPRRELGRVT